MAAKTKGSRNSERQNGKAFKKRPKTWDSEKRRLITK